MTLHTNDLTTSEKQYYLQHLIAPRPICFASTIDAAGAVNLSPFSFFNLFSSQPPIVIFSPTRRVRDNTTKHTLQNLEEVPEVAINIVTADIIHQVSLASCDYPKGTDEFIKAGFTKQNPSLIRPPLVAEAKAKFECRVNEIKSLGGNGGAGQLVIAEILCIHIDDDLLMENKLIDQRKISHVARLGGDWYAQVNADNLFTLPKPNARLGIGIDRLPPFIAKSSILTGNNLAQLANVENVPVKDPAFHDGRLEAIFYYFRQNDNRLKRLHIYAKELLEEGKTDHAWQVLLYGDNVNAHT